MMASPVTVSPTTTSADSPTTTSAVSTALTNAVSPAVISTSPVDLVMASPGTLSAYEGSDEASECDLLDQSLSVWKGWSSIENESFKPICLDIYTACSIGQYDCVRDIVERGEQDLNKCNKGGWTPLMYACYIGHDSIVHMLLDARVNVNVKNLKGQRALHLACSCGNESVVYFLLQAGAELEGRDRKGWTALFHATYSGHQNMVMFLLDNGADAEAREPRSGFTPFMEAAAAGHEIIVQYFLLHGIDAMVKSLSGHTARSVALAHGHTKIVSLIDNHILSPSVPLRSDAGLTLGSDLSSSDHGLQRHGRPGLQGRQAKYKGPSIRDGPKAFNKVFEAKKLGIHTKHIENQHSAETDSILTYEGGGAANQIRFRDVTSPISPEDHPLDSSGGRDSLDQEDDSNAFTKTGALTIKSSSGSSGGLIAALGLSRENSIDEAEEKLVQNSSPLQRSISDSVLRGLPNRPTDVTVGQEAPGDRYYGQQEVDNMNPYSQFGGPQMYGFYQGVPRNPSHTVEPNPAQPIPNPSSQNPIQNPMSLFSPQQPDFPQNHQISMLQHPLWQQHGYGTLPPPAVANQNPGIGYYGNQPAPPAPPETEQKAHVGLSTAAAAEQRQVFDDRPGDLVTFLEQLGLSKYLLTFDEQDVDLQVFLSLTDNDLKEIGIKLFGPRRKMTNAIARWHSNARPSHNDLEQAYADKLEADMQEMAIQLKLVKEEATQSRLQFQQEQQLRSVTEGCLVKDRATWHQVMALASDTRQACTDLQERLNTTRLYESEVCRRIKAAPQACLTGSGPSCSLAAALKEGLLLEERQQPIPAEISKLPTQQLLNNLEGLLMDVDSLVTMAVRHTDKLLDISPSSLPGYS